MQRLITLQIHSWELHLNIEEYSGNIDSQIIPQNDSQNFLEYWENQWPEDSGMKEEIVQIGGPVGQVLEEYDNNISHHHNNSLTEMDQYNIDQSYYNPQSDSAENLLKNFEEAVNANLSNSNFGDSNEPVEHPHNHSWNSEYHEDIENNSVHPQIVKAKRRDLKRARKHRTIQDSPGLQKVTRKLTKSKALPEQNDWSDTGLIIKIRSGNNIIMNEKIGHVKQSSADSGNACKPEDKKNSQECSSSTSTLSVEKAEDKLGKLSQMSICSIELDNNVKIVCRSIGPLKADQRREKVLHYLEKKRARKWKKRVIYRYAFYTFF